MWIKTSKKPLVLCGPVGSPYRINPEPEAGLPSRALSAKAAVCSSPPHTKQGKNKEKPVSNERRTYCFGESINVSRVFNGFFLASFEAGGHRPQPLGLRASVSREAHRLGVKTDGVPLGFKRSKRFFKVFI